MVCSCCHDLLSGRIQHTWCIISIRCQNYQLTGNGITVKHHVCSVVDMNRVWWHIKVQKWVVEHVTMSLCTDHARMTSTAGFSCKESNSRWHQPCNGWLNCHFLTVKNQRKRGWVRLTKSGLEGSRMHQISDSQTGRSYLKFNCKGKEVEAT